MHGYVTLDCFTQLQKNVLNEPLRLGAGLGLLEISSTLISPVRIDVILLAPDMVLSAGLCLGLSLTGGFL